MENINIRRQSALISAVGAYRRLLRTFWTSCLLVQKNAYRLPTDRWRGAFGADDRRQNADRTGAPAVSALNKDLDQFFILFIYFVFLFIIYYY